MAISLGGTWGSGSNGPGTDFGDLQLGNTGDITVGVLFKPPTDTTTTSGAELIANRDPPSLVNWWLRANGDGSGNASIIWAHEYSTTNAVSNSGDDSNYPITLDGTWQWVVCTLASDVPATYHATLAGAFTDETETTAVTGSGTPTNVSTDFAIGRRPDTGQDSTGGDYALAFVLSEALTQAQCDAMKHDPVRFLLSRGTTLQALWLPGMNGASSVLDISGNGGNSASVVSGSISAGPSLPLAPMPFSRTRRTGGYAAAGVTGSLSVSLAALTASGAGTVDVDGTLTKTLATLTASGAGTIDIDAALTATLAALASSATGAVDVDGSLSATLDALVLSGAADVLVSATLAATLGALTLDASGIVGTAGTLDATLAALTASGAGTVDVDGSLSATLAAVILASAGNVFVDGDLAVTLGDVTLASTGTVVGGEITGDLSVVLGALAAAATGDVDVDASLSATLGDVAASAAGGVLIDGTLTVSLESLGINAVAIIDFSGRRIMTTEGEGANRVELARTTNSVVSLRVNNSVKLLTEG